MRDTTGDNPMEKTKNSKTEVAEAPVSAQPVADASDDFPLSLDEFCVRLSQASKRTELIGAFHSVEKRSGRVKDTEAAFGKRFADFCKQPA